MALSGQECLRSRPPGLGQAGIRGSGYRSPAKKSSYQCKESIDVRGRRCAEKSSISAAAWLQVGNELLFRRFGLLCRLPEFDEAADVRILNHHGAAVLDLYDSAIGDRFGARSFSPGVYRVNVGHLKADVIDVDIGKVLVGGRLVSILRRAEQFEPHVFIGSCLRIPTIEHS